MKDLHRDLERVVLERHDVEEMPGPSSLYRRQRECFLDPQDPQEEQEEHTNHRDDGQPEISSAPTAAHPVTAPPKP